MARANITTLLPLDEYAQVLGIDPLHFNGIFSDLRPFSNRPDDAWVQYDWQNTGKIGRESLAEVISQAERKIAEYINYWPAPQWVVDERQETIRPARPELFQVGELNIRGLRKSVILDWKYVIAGGQEQKDIITAATAVVYSDSTGDSYDDLATMVVTVDADRDPCEIAVYYPGHAADPKWQIRPIAVTIVGTTATITARKYLFVDENLIETLNQDQLGVNGEDNSNFLATVDVYRRYNDPETQVEFIWEDPSTDDNILQNGFIGIRESRLSEVTYAPGTWDSDTESFTVNTYSRTREPERMRIWYLAGWRNQNEDCPRLQMDTIFKYLIARYATTLFDGELGGDQQFRKLVDYWRDDYVEQLKDRQHLATQRMLENPFGTTRAAWYVWTTLNRSNFRVGEGF